MALFGFLKRPKPPEPARENQPVREGEAEPYPWPLSPGRSQPQPAKYSGTVFAPARVIESQPEKPQAPAQSHLQSAQSQPDSAEAVEPVELRRRLFDAVVAGDEQHLTGLCQQHWDMLLREGPTWLDEGVPAPLRSNPQAADWYGQGVRAIAHFCAERLDRPELMQRLAGHSPADPARSESNNPAAAAAAAAPAAGAHPGQDAA